MRIALVTDYYPPTLGGVQTAVKALAEALTTAGHDVTVFCPLAAPPAASLAAPLATPATAAHVVGLPVARFFRPDGYPFAWSPRRVSRRLRAEFVARRIEVVHTHSEMFAALGAITAARSIGLPVVHTMHGRIDVYTAHVLPVPAVSTVLLGALHARQVSRRGLRVDAGSPYTATRAARRMWRLMSAQSRASEHVFVPSEHFARKLVDQGVTTPISVTSNGLEPSVLEAIGEPAPRLLGPDETLRVIWVGRLSPEKRPEVLVEAARRFGPRVTVDVYGDGMARRGLARRGGPVTLHGAVSHAEVLAAMRRSHLLVSSSFDFDNQPMVMLEAIATGLPVLHCDPDLAEVLPDGGGFVTSTPDADGIVAEIHRLRADPAAIAAASAVMVAERARVTSHVDATVAVYSEVVGRARVD